MFQPSGRRQHTHRPSVDLTVAARPSRDLVERLSGYGSARLGLLPERRAQPEPFINGLITRGRRLVLAGARVYGTRQ